MQSKRVIQARLQLQLVQHPNFFVAWGGFPALLEFGVGHGAAAVKSESGVAVITQHSIAGRISKFSELPAESKAAGFFSIFYAISIYVVNRKELKWMRTAWFSVMVARANKSTIGHHGFNANSLMGFLIQLSSIFHEIRIGKFSFPISLTVRNFFFISKGRLGVVAPNICASPGTKFIHFASVFPSVKQLLASWTDVFYFWHGCNHSAVRSHCQ